MQGHTALFSYSFENNKQIKFNSSLQWQRLILATRKDLCVYKDIKIPPALSLGSERERQVEVVFKDCLTACQVWTEGVSRLILDTSGIELMQVLT